MKKINLTLNESWMKVLGKELSKQYFKKLLKVLEKEYAQKSVYPPADQVFNAFNSTSFEDVKVVLLGQDPYHGEGQAHGLCFSVPRGIKPPHSLRNIFKELSEDTGIPTPPFGDLQSWANQGILLLNTTLTVCSGQPLSHHGIGWETFTDKVIQTLSEHKNGLIFLLWGKNAQTKETLIDTSKHYVLKAAHPSPFSARNGFFGCKHFSAANQLLQKNGLPEINWRISSE